MNRPKHKWRRCSLVVASLLCLLIISHNEAHALTPIPPPPPETSGFGLEATKKQPAPKRGATITTPGNGSSSSTSQITVNGICPTGLLVQLLNNNVMVGSVMCENGSFSVEVSLFAGDNELKAIVYDDLEQAGPTSNTVRVRYNDINLSAFGQQITLTSSYGRRAAPAGSRLVWPLQLSGGTGPYAFSIDWGDGTDPSLVSQSLSGVINISHTYSRAGIYLVNIKVTDVNDVSAFLQVTAVSSGKTDDSTKPESPSSEKLESEVKILWVPALIMFLLLIPTYWLGRSSQIVSLRKKIAKERDEIEKKL